MNKVAICRKIKEATKRIIVFSECEVVGSGTAVIINDQGVALTANHVINDMKKITTPRLIMISKDDDEKVAHIEYQVVLCDISFSVDMPQFIGPLSIDLAILKPKQSLNYKCKYVELDDGKAEEGEDVIMAGFPDEIKLPLDFPDKLNFDNPELSGKRNDFENALEANMALSMMKSGMVGAKFDINLKGKFNSHNVVINGAEYWIDNASTYGASGGSAINSRGKLIGILCEKAMTKFLPDIQIPSGSSRVLSHQLITWALKLT